MPAPARLLNDFARGHHGLFRWADAISADVSADALATLVSMGWCDQVHRGIYRVRGAPRTDLQRYLAGAWACGPDALVSHRAAANLWGLPGFQSAGVEVVRPHGQNQRLAWGRLHVSQCLPSHHRRTLHNIPITSVPRTVFDVAGVVHPELAGRTLDFALQRKLCTLEQVHQAFFLLARRGRRGTAAMRALLAERGLGYVPPASELERVAHRVFQEAGLETPEFEVDLGDTDWVARVDCLWRRQRVIVELDGERYHGGLSARRADRERDNRLMAAGWRVIRVTWDDLVHRPEVVVGWIRRALAEAA